MISEIEAYIGQLVTAGAPGDIAEIVEVLDPALRRDPEENDPLPRPRSCWYRLWGRPGGMFESRELRLALLKLDTVFVRRGAPTGRARILRHNASEKDPVEVSIDGRPQRMARREFLTQWRAAELATERHG
jgi:hypothetical protein